MKRIIALMMSLMCVAAIGCAHGEDNIDPTPSPNAPTPIPADSSSVYHDMIGFVVSDNGDTDTNVLMHGFLTTANELNRPAMLFKFKGKSACEAVKTAAERGCKGIVIDECDDMAEAVKLAKTYGMRVVALSAEPIDGTDSRIYIDDAEYIRELCSALGERMKERNLKSGRILVYGEDVDGAYSACTQVVREIYPMYGVISFTRTSADEQVATDELAEYILEHREIKGIIALSSDETNIAVEARKKASALFKERGGAPSAKPTNKPQKTPAPTETPSQLPGKTPELGDAEPTLPPFSESLLKSITISIFGFGLTEKNIAHLEKNDLYGVCCDPSYNVGVYAATLLDMMMLRKAAEAEMRVLRPIVLRDTLERYMSVYDEVNRMFGTDEP